MARTQVQSELIATNAISGTIIADNAITATHIATNSISGTLVQDSGIVTSMIAANNVTSAKIVTDAVLTRHIADDQVTGDKLTNNITIAGTLASTGVLTANAGVVVDNITIDGTEIDLSSGDLTIDVAGTISLDTDSGGIYFKDGGTTIGEFINSSSDFMLKSAVQDKDILLKGNDGGSTITALQLDMSEEGAALFNGNIFVSGGSDRRIQLGNGGAGANQVDNNTVHIRGDGVNAKYMAASGGVHQFEVNGLERFKIDTADIVLTTTGNANATLSVKNVSASGQAGIQLSGYDDNHAIMFRRGYDGTLNVTDFYQYGSYRFFNNGVQANQTEKLHIGTDGRQKFNGTATANGHGNFVGEVGSGYKALSFERTVGGGEVGSVVANTSSTTYNTSSDYRLKENIRPIENGLERLNNLNPVKFDWKSDGTSSEGFIAHEIQEIFPDAVSGDKDDEMMQGMDYGRITPLLVKSVQEQQTIIDDLKGRIKTLEG